MNLEEEINKSFAEKRDEILNDLKKVTQERDLLIEANNNLITENIGLEDQVADNKQAISTQLSVLNDLFETVAKAKLEMSQAFQLLLDTNTLVVETSKLQAETLQTVSAEIKACAEAMVSFKDSINGIGEVLNNSAEVSKTTSIELAHAFDTQIKAVLEQIEPLTNRLVWVKEKEVELSNKETFLLSKEEALSKNGGKIVVS